MDLLVFGGGQGFAGGVGDTSGQLCLTEPAITVHKTQFSTNIQSKASYEPGDFKNLKQKIEK